MTTSKAECLPLAVAMFIALLCAASAKAAHGTGAFCKSFKAARAEGSNHFINLRLAETVPGQWSTKLKIDGFSTCNVNITPDKGSSALFCMTGPLPGGQSLREKLWDLVRQIDACTSGELSLLGEPSGGNAFLMGPAGRGSVTVMETTTLAKSEQTQQWEVLPNLTLSILEDLPPKPANQPDSPTTEDSAGSTSDSPDSAFALPTEKVFCKPLNQVVTSSETQFQNIRGRGDSESGWDTDFKLPKLVHCRIETLSGKDPYYSCLVSRQTNAGTAAKDFTGVENLIHSCLGPKWEGVRHNRANGARSTHFLEKEGGTDVEVRLSAPRSQGEYALHLDVSSPGGG